MLINLSNHPLSSWSPKQRETAYALFGEVVDLPFPPIPADWGHEEVADFADGYFDQCRSLLANSVGETAVHIAGEPVFCFVLAQRLLRVGVRCVSTTTERIVHIDKDKKVAEFRFERFRDYVLV